MSLDRALLTARPPQASGMESLLPQEVAPPPFQMPGQGQPQEQKQGTTTQQRQDDRFARPSHSTRPGSSASSVSSTSSAFGGVAPQQHTGAVSPYGNSRLRAYLEHLPPGHPHLASFVSSSSRSETADPTIAAGGVGVFLLGGLFPVVAPLGLLDFLRASSSSPTSTSPSTSSSTSSGVVPGEGCALSLSATVTHLADAEEIGRLAFLPALIFNTSDLLITSLRDLCSRQVQALPPLPSPTLCSTPTVSTVRSLGAGDYLMTSPSPPVTPRVSLNAVNMMNSAHSVGALSAGITILSNDHLARPRSVSVPSAAAFDAHFAGGFSDDVYDAIVTQTPPAGSLRPPGPKVASTSPSLSPLASPLASPFASPSATAPAGAILTRRVSSSPALKFGAFDPAGGAEQAILYPPPPPTAGRGLGASVAAAAVKNSKRGAGTRSPASSISTASAGSHGDLASPKAGRRRPPALSKIRQRADSEPATVNPDASPGGGHANPNTHIAHHTGVAGGAGGVAGNNLGGFLRKRGQVSRSDGSLPDLAQLQRRCHLADGAPHRDQYNGEVGCFSDGGFPDDTAEGRTRKMSRPSSAGDLDRYCVEEDPGSGMDTTTPQGSHRRLSSEDYFVRALLEGGDAGGGQMLTGQEDDFDLPSFSAGIAMTEALILEGQVWPAPSQDLVYLHFPSPVPPAPPTRQLGIPHPSFDRRDDRHDDRHDDRRDDGGGRGHSLALLNSLGEMRDAQWAPGASRPSSTHPSPGTTALLFSGTSSLSSSLSGLAGPGIPDSEDGLQDQPMLMDLDDLFPSAQRPPETGDEGDF